MTVTISVTDWESMVGSKNFSPQSLISSARKLVMYIAVVTMGAGDNYATGGVSANILARGAQTLKHVIPIDNDALVIARYDKTNKKILMYGEINDDAAGVNTAAKALTELANASTIPNSKVFSFLVFAQT